MTKQDDNKAIVGRWFSDKDDTPGSPETVMLSHSYWERKFGGASSAIGRSIHIDGRLCEIIGVMPAGFRLLDQKADIIQPFRFDRAKTFLGNFSYSGIARLKPGRVLQMANDRIQSLLRMGRRTLESHPHMGNSRQPLVQLPDDPRLADPRLAGQQDRLPFAGRSALEAVKQQGDLVLAPDEAGEPSGTGVEAAFDRALGEHLPNPHRLGDAFQLLRPKIVEDERSADELPCQPADHDLVLARQSFQTRRQVRGLAGDGPRLPSAGGLEIADDDGAGRDPDMHVQRQFSCRRDRCEPGAHRLRRLVLLSPRPAEVYQDAVAQVVRDIAAKADDNLGHGIVIASQQLAQILRVVLAGQLGRANEIAEQHGQLPAFRLARGIAALRGGFGGGLRSFPGQLGNRAQEPAAEAERQPQLFQIPVGKLGQDIEVDVVSGEDLGELLQSDVLKPVVKIVGHGSPPYLPPARLLAEIDAQRGFADDFVGEH